ncbi:MAG: hypothetical protein HYX80_05955 [Chloroflexi bacterium]|nr:hypothetical protein [Chloroflexota bacterium]
MLFVSCTSNPPTQRTTPEPGAPTPTQPQQGKSPSPTPSTSIPSPKATVPSLRQYPKVILGKENWLYYGEPMNRLVNEGLLTDAQIDKAIDELVYISDSLKERGVHLLFLLVPDKQLIYPEFMPEKYNDVTGTQLSSYERMSQALSATDIDFIDTRPILLEKKRETGFRLYYMRDNKWNQYGNFLMTQEIMSRLGKSFPVPQYELTSVDTSATRILTEELGNDLNLMMQSLVSWSEKGAPEPVYSVSEKEGAPGILWYGDCFGTPMTDFIRQNWPNSVTYVSLWSNYGFPLSFREDLERRLNGEKIVVIELDEHYRQELSRSLVPELPKIDTSWSLYRNWQANSFLNGWAPAGEYDVRVADDKVLVTVNDTTSPPSFYSAEPLALDPAKKYYLVIKITSPDFTGMLADFSKTSKGEFSFDWLQGRHIYKGDNTIIFEFPPDQAYLNSIRSLRIYLGDKPGTYGISEAAIYAKTR